MTAFQAVGCGFDPRLPLQFIHFTMISRSDLYNEFDRQLINLIERGYPSLLNFSDAEFRSQISTLGSLLDNAELPEIDLEKGTLPFAIVVKSGLLTSEQMMGLTQKDGRNGVTILRPHTSQSFKTIDDIALPESRFYLLLNIDRGKSNINLPPVEAMRLIKEANRSPLTIDEGIAIVTHYPEFLMKNNCFSLLASRTGTDKRVPAIWINGKKEPNLGWCWDGNPHTWLGSASCTSRLS